VAVRDGGEGGAPGDPGDGGPMIGICTDSNAQLPPELVDRYGVEVVPLTVTVDGVDHLEGVDLDADGFYARFAKGRRPQVTTSQPSPGRFTDAYRALAAGGATDILSIHVGSAVSGTLNAATLGSRGSPVPVRLVDTGTASFGVGCCVWEAGEAVLAGAGVEEAARVAEQLAATVGNVFVVGALDLAKAGGRLAAGVDDGGDGGEHGIPVLSLVEGEIRAVGRAADAEAAAAVMADHVCLGGTGLRVAVGVADAAAGSVGDALAARLDGRPEVREIVRYRVGPSVGAHTGPGTAGAFFHPARAGGGRSG
jgi:DegV family protein with EDD domain